MHLGLDGCHVYLRDIIADTWERHEASAWVDAYAARVADAVRLQMTTIGGSLTMSGTAESGRVTVTAADGRRVLLDYDWHTLTSGQALGEEPREAEPGPPPVNPPGRKSL